MVDAINNFGLDYKQTGLLFNIQYDIVYRDIIEESNTNKQTMKLNWLNEWSKEIRTTLKKMSEDEFFINGLNILNQSDINEEHFYIKQKYTNNLINSICKECYNNKLPLYLIYMEVSLFEPYFNLNKETDKKLFENVKERFKKENNLKYTQAIIINKELAVYAEQMNIDNISSVNFKKLYSKIISRITNKNIKIVGGVAIGAMLVAITAGYAAPAIGAAFAPAGIFGAAAVSSGLAFLGGGAIAAGGFGMAGGIAVVVGGGAILGAGIGGGAGFTMSLIKSSSEFTLSQAARLEIVIKEILLTNQKDIRMAQELIREQREAIKVLEDEIVDMKMESESNKEEIKNLEKSVKYMKKVLDECINNLNK